MNGVRIVGAATVATAYPLGLVAAHFDLIPSGWGVFAFGVIQGIIGLVLIVGPEDNKEKKDG